MLVSHDMPGLTSTAHAVLLELYAALQMDRHVHMCKGVNTCMHLQSSLTYPACTVDNCNWQCTGLQQTTPCTFKEPTSAKFIDSVLHIDKGDIEDIHIVL